MVKRYKMIIQDVIFLLIFTTAVIYIWKNKSTTALEIALTGITIIIVLRINIWRKRFKSRK
jgi:hypothetical protein